MSVRQTMKLGFIGFIYTPPDEITDPLEGFLWQVDKAAELGCQVFHGRGYPNDRASLETVKDRLEEKGIELEVGAPRELFELAGPDAASARKTVEAEIEVAKLLGSRIMRSGYGRLTIETSRFSKTNPPEEQLEFITKNLEEAAKIYRANDIYYALENHCDFIGRDFVRIFDTVDSPYIGSALDTANGFTVYWDPNDDVEVLAPYAITTHIKDMKVSQHQSDLIMFQAQGCPLGEGHVDIPRAIDLLEKHSPHADGLHLVIEQGWLAYEPDKDRKAQDKAALEQSLVWLRDLIS